MSKASFHWEDPFLLDQQLTEEERMVRDAARSYAQDKLAPRILDAILSVMPVDDMVPEAVWRPAAYLDPNRMEPVFEDFTAILLKHEPAQKIVPLTGDAFYNKVKACFAVVASSEPRLYGNIIVKKGVIHPA